MVKAGHNFALVIQDDVNLHDDLQKVIPMFLKKAPSTTDILFLHNIPLDGEHFTADAYEFVVNEPPMQRFVGAYFLNLRAAKMLLKNFQPDKVIPIEQYIAAHHNKFEDPAVEKHYKLSSKNLQVSACNIQLVDLHFKSRRYDSLSDRAKNQRARGEL